LLPIGAPLPGAPPCILQRRLPRTAGVRCKSGFLLPVRVLSRLFRRLFLAALADAHAAGRLAFYGEIANLRRREAFAAHLAPLKRKVLVLWHVPTDWAEQRFFRS